MHRKYAKADILDVRYSSNKLSPEQLGNGFNKLAKPSEISDDGYLYVTVRAISSRVNKNKDGWPSLELARTDPGYGYKTFEYRPIFIDHNNDNPENTRGVVVASTLHVEDEKKASSFDPYYATAPDNHLPPTWIELMLEVDAKEYPKLAKKIISGEIDSVSMGANIEISKCSVCDHEAENPTEYCTHVQNKGATFEVTSENGEKSHKLAYEDCYGINFFEISFVFDPADETALISDMSAERKAAIQAVAALETAGAPVPEELRKQALGPIPHPDDPPLGPYDYEADDMDLDEPTPATRPSDEEQTNAWRKEQFMALGLSGLEADQAIMAGVDYHDLGNFLQQYPGATPDQALRILSSTQKISDAAISYYKSLREDGVPSEDAMQAVATKYFNGDLEKARAYVAQNVQLTGKIAAGPPDHEHHNLDMHRQDVQRERNLNHEPQADKMTAPDQVDTLRPEIICKNCGSTVEPDNAGQLICQECGYEVEPEGLDNPDLELAKDIDLRQDKTEEVNPEGQMETELEHDKGETDVPSKNPIKPVAPISSTQSDTVSDEMKFSDVEKTDSVNADPAMVRGIVAFMKGTGVEVEDEIELARIVSEADNFDGEPTIYDAAEAIEVYAAVTDNADSKSTTKVVTDKKKPSGSPASQAAGERIISDQLEPVESNKFEELASNEENMENEKTADRETIKRVEEDGSGVKRTEEITKEYGPMAEAGDEPAEGEEAAPEESEEEQAEGEGEESEELAPAAEGDAEEVNAEETPEADAESGIPDHNLSEEEKVPAMASTEGKLMAALKLAKLAASLGVISSDDELEYAGELESSESMEEINARTRMLDSVKEAGLSKKRRPVVAGRLPSFAAKNSSFDEVDDADDSALFL